MNRKRQRLAERRQRLVLDAAAQRVTLAADLAPWRPRLARIDQGLAVLRTLRDHPAVLAGAALLIAAGVRRGGAGGWLRRGWLAWQIRRGLLGR